MQFNEDRVKLFATILRLLTNPGILKQLADKGEEFDFENLVRAIAEMVPLPAIDVAAPVICPLPHQILPTIPNTIPGWTPMRPLIGDPPGWPNNPTVICSGQTSDQTGVVPFLSGMTVVEKPTQSAMTQADGEGDDSGLRAD